ncbi:hypothetical protein GJ496_003905 [Pomphorhynchus laevis]|nr:hypothetical protein GJ496_003905 [Pomphorhynchus laevis]
MDIVFMSPTHAGGLLAIDREWFFEIGAYDDGIKIWGGEQYELSFKVWLCGGVLKWVPCSHVAHIYRGPRKSNFPNPTAQSHQTDRNHLRLSAIWMDEYQKYYRTREPATTKLSFGSIDDQLAIKERLQCKSFDWFMKNVAYEMFKKYPFPPDNVAWGNLQNKKFPVCMDQMGAGFGDAVKVSKYCGQIIDQGFELSSLQWFRLNTKGELSTGEYCFRTKGKPVIKYHCLKDGSWIPEGEWTYLESEMQMKSKTANKCLDTDGIDLFMSDCDTGSDSLKWTWNKMYYS